MDRDYRNADQEGQIMPKGYFSNASPEFITGAKVKILILKRQNNISDGLEMNRTDMAAEWDDR